MGKQSRNEVSLRHGPYFTNGTTGTTGYFIRRPYHPWQIWKLSDPGTANSGQTTPLPVGNLYDTGSRLGIYSACSIQITSYSNSKTNGNRSKRRKFITWCRSYPRRDITGWDCQPSANHRRMDEEEWYGYLQHCYNTPIL